MVEPVVGNPQEMSEAIAKALELIDEWRESDRGTPIRTLEDVYEVAEMARERIYQIEDALENYTED